MKTPPLVITYRAITVAITIATIAGIALAALGAEGLGPLGWLAGHGANTVLG